MSPHFVKKHAIKRAAERGIPESTFWDAYREATRKGVQTDLEVQHRKMAPMLTEKKVQYKVGSRIFHASIHEIDTRLEVNGTTVAVGIRRDGDMYSSLACITAWH